MARRRVAIPDLVQDGIMTIVGVGTIDRRMGVTIVGVGTIDRRMGVTIVGVGTINRRMGGEIGINNRAGIVRGISALDRADKQGPRLRADGPTDTRATNVVPSPPGNRVDSKIVAIALSQVSRVSQTGLRRNRNGRA